MVAELGAGTHGPQFPDLGDVAQPTRAYQNQNRYITEA